MHSLATARSTLVPSTQRESTVIGGDGSSTMTFLLTIRDGAQLYRITGQKKQNVGKREITLRRLGDDGWHPLESQYVDGGLYSATAEMYERMREIYQVYPDRVFLEPGVGPVIDLPELQEQLGIDPGTTVVDDYVDHVEEVED